MTRVETYDERPPSKTDRRGEPLAGFPVTRHVAFRQADIRRACQAVEAVGLCVDAVEIWPDGRLRVLTSGQTEDLESGSSRDWTDYAGETEISRA